uniref:RanBP2-type domain-containing protein n=1 Tax=Glossina pallidipes TaxID=7398 RepID=A0A1A9ZUH7_GLOPL
MSERSLHGESIDQNEATENTSVDDAIDINGNTIIGIVKSSIARILPNRIAKWISKSGKAQKRCHRLLEVDDEDAIEDINDDLHSKHGEWHERNRCDRQNENSVEDELDDKSYNSGEKVRKRDLNSYQTITCESPAKRSRIASIQNIPSVANNGSPIVLTSSRSSCQTRSCNRDALLRSSHQRGYSHQLRMKQSRLNLETNITDIVSTPIELGKDVSSVNSGALNISQINSRRALNVSLSASNAGGSDNFATNSRQSLSNVKQSLLADIEAETVSCCIEDINQSGKHSGLSKDIDDEIRQVSRRGANQSMATTNARSEKDESGIKDARMDTTVGNASREIEKTCQQRKIGLYDMIPASGTRQVNRLSLYTQTSVSDGTPKTSTLPFSSKIPYQFNASNSGGTSALKNTSLPNIFSPFYEGKTTYGGAAAYPRIYNGIGVPAVHKARTFKRSFLGLSKLSLDNKSLSATGHIGDNSTMTRAAKHVRHLINDLNTPVRNVSPSKELVAETPSSSVNLLMMKPVPQSDIQLEVSLSSTTTKQPTVAATTTALAHNQQPTKTLPNPTVSEPLLGTFTSKHTTDFIRSSPETLTGISPSYAQNIKSKNTQHYKFSPPIYLEGSCKSVSSLGNLDHKNGTQAKNGSFSEIVIEELITSSTAFRGKFKMSPGEWSEEVCMSRNNEESSECVADETTKKVSSSTSISMADNGSGDMFKSKSNIWQFGQCSVDGRNKNPGDNEKFVSRGGSVASTSVFQFACPAQKLVDINHTNAITSNFSASAPVDSGLKLLPAQETTSKWECDVCMTRNDVNRIKCTCCEHPKPKSIFTNASGNNANKFTFVGSVGKFSFDSVPSNISEDRNESKQATTALTTTVSTAMKPTLFTEDFETQISAWICKRSNVIENSSDNTNKNPCVDDITILEQGNMPTSVTTVGTFKKNSETISSTSGASTNTFVGFSSITEQVTNSQNTSQAMLVDPTVQSSNDSRFSVTAPINTAFSTGATVTQESVFIFTGHTESKLTADSHFNGDNSSTSHNVFMPAPIRGDRLARQRRRKTRRVRPW